MGKRIVTTLCKWLLALGLLGGLAYGLFLVHARLQGERGENEPAAKGNSPRGRESFVSLEEDEIERYGLETKPALALRWYPRVPVYGRVLVNPQAAAEVRSPFAGTLRTPTGSTWPRLGQRVRAGQKLGWVDVRVGPEVRLELHNKLSDAAIRQRGAEEEVKLQQDRVNSLKAVTSQQIIARAELDAALVQLAQAKNQLATAKAAAQLWQDALREVERHKGDDGSPWSQPLVAPAEGEVTELPGRPGSMVEAGSLIFGVVDFRRPLVRLDIPPEVLARGDPPRRVAMHLSAAASPGGILQAAHPAESALSAEASLVGPAPQVDGASQFPGYWYEVRLPSEGGQAAAVLWRPGMQVTAEVRTEEAAPQSAVAVPAGAVLYHEGRPLVYVRVGEEKFERREVRLLGREGQRWIVAVRQGNLPVGVSAGEAVVCRQAQVLLSKEFLVGTADED